MKTRAGNRRLMALLALASGVCHGAATITGIVIDDSGTPVSGSRVHYNNSPATKADVYGHNRPTEPFVSSHVITAKDGTFTIAGLSPSVYWLCANGITPTQLRSCDWGQPSTKVDLRTVATASLVRLIVANGVLLTFVVSDPQSHIKDFAATPLVNGKVAPPGNFRIFVVDAHRYMAASLISAVGTTHTYSLTVPKGRSLVHFLDTLLQASDSALSAIPTRQPTNPIGVGAQAVTVQLSVQ